MHAIIYTDGSSKPNPGKTGWGAHGYRYEPTNNRTRKLDDYFITNKGYLLKSEMADGVELVWPIEFYDFSVYETNHGSNNSGELAAVVGVLKFFRGHDIASLTIYTDSEYVRKGIYDSLETWKSRDWKNGDGNKVHLADTWVELSELIDYYKSINVPVNVEWVKGHQHYGNVLADQLAKIAVNSTDETKDRIEDRFQDFTVSPADGYGKVSFDKHPFICFKRMFFTNQMAMDGGKYYLAEPGDGVESLGKRHNEAAYGVIYLDRPDAVIEHIKANHRTASQDHACTVVARLDRIFDKSVYPYIYKYGKGSLIPSSNKYKFGITDIDFIDGRNITTELIPTGLSFLGMEVLGLLDGMLTTYSRNLVEGVNTPDSLLGPDYCIVDITDRLYDSINKKDGVSYSFKSIYGVGTKSASLTIPIKLNGIEKNIEILLTFGGDLPFRNNLKQMESLQPQVKVVVWAESQILYRYACIVNVEGAMSIWSNYYSNRVLSLA